MQPQDMFWGAYFGSCTDRFVFVGCSTAQLKRDWSNAHSLRSTKYLA